MTARCPRCELQQQAHRVLYMGLPMWLCRDFECSTLFGFWSFVAALFPVSSEDPSGRPAFAFMAYEGGYLPALLTWLRGAA